MNGIHDLGGMHGFGAIDTSDHDELFHEEWEALAFAMQVVMIHGADTYNLHEFRRAREQVAPEEYLGSSYYDNWLAAVEKLAIEKGIVTEAELRDRIEAFEDEDATGDIPSYEDSELTGRTLDRIHNREQLATEGDPAFKEGDLVVVRNIHPEGHTRCPRYVRRCRGRIDQVYGTFPLPDVEDHGDHRVEPLYSAQFEAGEVWEEYTDATDVHLDLWESYIEPAPQEDNS